MPAWLYLGREDIPALRQKIESGRAADMFAELGVPVIDTDVIAREVVERGAGETLACGSGACAAMAILRRWGRVDDRLEVALPGGRLVIKWRGGDEPLIMKGPATYVFRGTMDE